MRTRFFEIGDKDWGLLLCYDYDQNQRDDADINAIMKSFGIGKSSARKAMKVLENPDTGMTISSPENMMSAVFVSEATSDEEWLDTLFHELKHVVEHISSFYAVDPRGEQSAYLQGEIGRQLFPVIMSKLCTNT